MTKIIVKEIVWDEWNREHIKKHSVLEKEVEEAIKNLAYHKRTYLSRYLLVGRSGGRILSIVLKKLSRAKYYLITARDASKKERKALYEKERDKQDSKI